MTTADMTTVLPELAGPQGHPVLGSFTEYRHDLLGFLRRCAVDHGDLVPVRVVFHRGFLVSSPELANEVLVRRAHDYRKVFPLRYNRLFLGSGLLTSEGDQWKADRRLVQPAFHADRIAGYGSIVVEEAARTRDRWQAGQVVDMQQEMAELTLRVVVRCLFDVDTALDFETISWAVGVIQERMRERYRAMIPLPDSAWTPQNLRFRQALRVLDRIVYGFIAQRRNAAADRTDLLSMLMHARREDGTRASDKQVRDQIMTMFFAGHETTALALSWSLYLLSRHPEAADEVRAELALVLGERTPTAADLPGLRLTGQVVMESMRLYPPVYAFGRDAVRDTRIGGHTIPARSSVIIAPWVMHHDARLFAHPLEFRPDRWTEEFARSLPKLAYCPFGGGARMCVGKNFAMMEAVLALATLLRDCRVRPASNEPAELWPTFTLRSRQGIPLTVAASHDSPLCLAGAASR
ncbi:MAG TPA: cytochrome P450 [Streptosporangiaceae bacterium]|nr:cytochrome P450 [Streptosporangiaceae bacterium]